MMNLLVLLACVVVFAQATSKWGIGIDDELHKGTCSNGKYSIVESIPIGVDLKTNMTTYEGWAEILESATRSIRIAQFYFTLTDGQQYPPEYGGYMGENIFQMLIDAYHRGVEIKIVQNMPGAGFPDNDTKVLSEMGAAEVRSINWTELIGGGILHTKLIIVDEKDIYIGSANTDWRSLAQVKELGIVIQNCSEVARDVNKIFDMYWEASNVTQIPLWAHDLDTSFNLLHPAKLNLNGNPSPLFIASSPIQFCTPSRSDDLNALIFAIDDAQSSISVEVMDFAPCSFYYPKNFYWPAITEALTRAAFERNVQVRLLLSKWNYTDPVSLQFINALSCIDNINIRLFEIPDMENSTYIPYTRVNHAKFMVTESRTYIGTSNWTADYYTNTGGLSVNTVADDIREQVQAIFNRDWNSNYTTPVQCITNNIRSEL